MTHKELVDISALWLNRQGCHIVVKEISCTGTNEIPDAIGFKSDMSILVECKSSRSDFLADKKKNFRKNPERGMGDHRYFISPPDVIKETDDLNGWGLLHVVNGKVRRIIDPIKVRREGFWNGGKIHTEYDWYKRQFKKNSRAEISLLASVSRRLATSPIYMQGKYVASTYIDETNIKKD